MLGEAVGLRLLSCGHTVAVHNRTLAKTARLAGAGASVMDSAREVAAASDVAITCVTDADAVRDVAFGPDGLAAGAHAGLVVADMSTVCPDDSREISRRLSSERGIPMVGAPVMGGPDAAATGRLVVIARMARGEYPATFLLRNLEKDIGMAVRLAGSRGARLPGAEAARAAYAGAVRAGHGELDYTGILRHISGR